MIGEKDSAGNIFRLGGNEVSIWEQSNGTFVLQFADPKKFFIASTEEDALKWYNQIEDKNFFKLPDLPERVNSQKEEEDKPLLLPEGAVLLGKFESQSTPGMFHYVIQYQDSATRCSCWPFVLSKTCNHYQLTKSVLETVPLDKLIEHPIVVKYNREEAQDD